MMKKKTYLMVVITLLAWLLCCLSLYGQDGYSFVLSWPQGIGFNRAAGVAVDNSGNIYVTDTLNNRVQKLNPNMELIDMSQGGK
ncbi:MAG: hypothetical protein AAB116_19090 [Candidatus Poribacteria bacterium]